MRLEALAVTVIQKITSCSLGTTVEVSLLNKRSAGAIRGWRVDDTGFAETEAMRCKGKEDTLVQGPSIMRVSGYR